LSIIIVLQVKIYSNDKMIVENTPCPNCKNYLENHTNEQIIQCANNELKKINSLESDSTPKSSEETPTGGFII
jgi:transcription initiation factor IIE alpha subunit|tara:strand:+ start:40 stop:258 length:219 start_codon:yes stop_codon:yes gene_type:complete